MTSEALARCMNTNPVVVRRTMAGLREMRLVRSEKGHAGGWRLARAASAVTVAEVQEALGEGLLAHRLAGDGGPATCAIERALHEAVDAALREAEALLAQRLARVTVADLARGMAAPGGTSGFAPKGGAQP